MSDDEEIKQVDVQKGEEKEIDLEDAANMDEQVYNQRNDLMDDNIESEFQCINPQMKSGHIVYTCKGMDQ